MPPGYSRRQREQNSYTPLEPTDFDDSIVLSDLVRTGEASRLRRRGAMRLERGLAGAQQNESGRRSPPAVVIVRSPPWESADLQSDEESQVWEQNYDEVAESQPQMQGLLSAQDPYSFTLFCGGEMTDYSATHGSSFEPSPLPSYTLDSPSGSIRRSSKVSNGCGAVIHLHALPQYKQDAWVAKSEATDAVVPMEAFYFDRCAVVKILRSSCGCIREGVGCAICGNAFGTRYKPCRAAAEGLFTSCKRTTTPMRPEGRRYWRSHISADSRHRHPYIYTFFASNVSSSPAFDFPSRDTSTIRHSPSFQLRGPRDDPTSYAFFDRLMTASPEPLTESIGSDDSFEGETMPSRPEPEFDPDGVLLATTPSSPDKVAELMPLPER